MTEDLSVEISNTVAILEIRRGPANFFDADLLRDIADTAQQLQASGHVRAIVLASQGKHFCAGANFGAGALRDDRTAAADRVYEQGLRLLELEMPIVAAVQGSAIGGGLGLACAADFRVASRSSRFVANFAGLGFHHGFALTVTLPRIIGDQRALDLLLTARRVNGTEGHAIGLVDRLAEPGHERAAAVTLAHEIADLAPLAIRSIKQTQRTALLAESKKALAHELAEQSQLWQTEDCAAGLAASAARETPMFVGR